MPASNSRCATGRHWRPVFFLDCDNRLGRRTIRQEFQEMAYRANRLPRRTPMPCACKSPHETQDNGVGGLVPPSMDLMLSESSALVAPHTYTLMKRSLRLIPKAGSSAATFLIASPVNSSLRPSGRGTAYFSEEYTSGHSYVRITLREAARKVYKGHALNSVRWPVLK
jgi:hypothetical protein